MLNNTQPLFLYRNTGKEFAPMGRVTLVHADRNTVTTIDQHGMEMEWAAWTFKVNAKYAVYHFATNADFSRNLGMPTAIIASAKTWNDLFDWKLFCRWTYYSKWFKPTRKIRTASNDYIDPRPYITEYSGAGWERKVQSNCGGWCAHLAVSYLMKEDIMENVKRALLCGAVAYSKSDWSGTKTWMCRRWASPDFQEVDGVWGMTVSQFRKKYPTGKYLVRTNGHAFVIDEGRVVDYKEGGRRVLRGAWEYTPTPVTDPVVNDRWQFEMF